MTLQRFQNYPVKIFVVKLMLNLDQVQRKYASCHKYGKQGVQDIQHHEMFLANSILVKSKSIFIWLPNKL